VLASLLTSAWDTEDVRPRKFYRTSAAGEQLTDALLTDWHEIVPLGGLTDRGTR
jgi:PadR family transcriptional regulator PadR